MPKQADGEANKPWMIRDMPVETRREVKIFAARAGMTMAEALDFLVNAALYMVVQDSDFPGLTKGDPKARFMVRPLQLRNQEDFATMLEAVKKVVDHLGSGTREEQKQRSRADFAAQQELRGRIWREGEDEADDAE